MKRPITIDDLYRIVNLESPRVSPDERWIAYVQETVDKLENGYKRYIWLAPTVGGTPIQLTRGGQDSQPCWSPDGKTLAFTSVRGTKPQVYLISVAEPGGEAYPLTNMRNGASNPVWSPNGKLIAFLSPMDADERAQEDRGETLAAPNDSLEARYLKERLQQAEEQRFDPHIAWRIPYRDGYGKSYLDGRYKQIYVTEARVQAQPRRLTDLDADHGVPEWTPDSQNLLTFRPSDHLADEPSRFDCLYRIGLPDAATQRLTAEEFADRMPTPSPNGEWIAYIRVPHEKQYTRVPRLAVLPTTGAGGRDLTLEFDRTAADCRWAHDSSAIFFRAHNNGNTELFKVAPTGGAIEKVVSGTMEMQSFDVGRSGGIAYVASTPLSPDELFWLPNAESPAQQLTQVNKALLDEVIVQPTYEVRYPSYDGSQVQGWYILPTGYQEGHSCPLILHIHGGPRVMFNPSSKMWHEWQTHTARGYAVFYCNPHGSDGYGQEFQRHSYGEPDFPDHMAGVDLMIEKGIADPKRLTVTGGSYGGYMTVWVVGQTNRFVAAVAQRGVYNLISQYGTTDFPIPTIHEFDVNPWEDPMLLWKYSPLAYAHKIKTPLLLIHSGNDYRVAISEAEQLFAFIRLSGGTVKLVRFPREGHGLSRTGEPEHRVQRLSHMLDWFDHYCQA